MAPRIVFVFFSFFSVFSDLLSLVGIRFEHSVWFWWLFRYFFHAQMPKAIQFSRLVGFAAASSTGGSVTWQHFECVSICRSFVRSIGEPKSFTMQNKWLMLSTLVIQICVRWSVESIFKFFVCLGHNTITLVCRCSFDLNRIGGSSLLFFHLLWCKIFSFSRKIYHRRSL